MSNSLDLFDELTTPEGVRVEIRDQSRNYGYQNVYEVRLRVTATFPGTGEVFERTLEKMGVFEDALDQTRRELVAAFKKTGLPYLTREGFAQRLKSSREARRPRAVGYGT